MCPHVRLWKHCYYSIPILLGWGILLCSVYNYEVITYIARAAALWLLCVFLCVFFRLFLCLFGSLQCLLLPRYLTDDQVLKKTL